MNHLQNTPQNKPVVAFIDDDQRILNAMEKLLRDTHQVFCTTDPDAYLDFIKNNMVHVAVSDQRMPVRLGVDILSDVKNISPHTMRILLTGYADIQAILSSINDGEIFRYLTKPFNADDVLKVIQNASEISIDLFNTAPRKVDLVNNATVVTPQNKTDVAKPTILALDSEEDIQEMQKKLGKLFNFKWARTAEEALEHIEKDNINVLISDVQIDGENVTPTIYKLKKHTKELVVLIQTHIKDATQLIDLINKGQVYRVLPKPVRFSLTKVSIERAYQHHLQLVSMPAISHQTNLEAPEESQKASLENTVSQAVSQLQSAGYFNKQPD